MPRCRLLKELLLYGAILVLGTLLLAEFDALEALHEFSRAHEDWELDEMILLFPVGALCLALFSYNRSRELRARAGELDHARNELVKAHERLKEMSRAREDFIAISCHELKSPLNGIIHSLELLNMSRDAEERREGIALAMSSAKGLETLIDGVLEFSRLYNEEHRNRVRFSPRDMMEAIRPLARLQADAKKLAFHMELDDTVPRSVTGHEAGLRLAILNLVGNAIKFTESGTVAVSLSMGRDEAARELAVTVTDTGIGICREELESIFEPYRRTAMAQGAGLGLGLAIVRRLVDGMGGSITVSSTVGRGTEFILRVPVDPN
ncbi:MAG: hypothetical protein H0S80_14185 [Desulfovibrionaceae bacterium]|nr:hypothetical protein [Desulfovibrionaceae bacterium]